MLRLAQLDVAIATDRADRLEIIADRLIEEARKLDLENVSNGFVSIAICKLLMERSLPISPRKWMPLLEEFDELLTGDNEFMKSARVLGADTGGPENWTVSQAMFVNRATALHGVDDLVTLFDELDQLNPERRNDLLSAFREPYTGCRVAIHSAWLTEAREGTIDGVRTEQKYGHLVPIAERWGNSDLAVECECARAVMLDEYAHDASSALSVLDESEKRYPDDIRLARTRAKIHFRRGEYAAALDAFEPIADSLPKDDAIERAFALREAGISAANTGDLPKARRFFGLAYESASLVGNQMLPMAAGLKADCAVTEFQMENYEEALYLAKHALRDADEIDPETGPKEKYCSLILGHMILWMRSQVQGRDRSGEDMPITAGSCSNPDPPKEITTRKTPPRLLVWYQLAELEAELGINAEIYGELRERTAKGEIITFEITLIFTLMARNIRSVDVEGFLSILPEYVSKAAFMISEGQNLRDEDIFNPRTGAIELVGPEDWNSEPYLQVAQNAILGIAISGVCSGRNDVCDELAVRIDEIEGANDALKPFLEFFKGNLSASLDAKNLAAACIGRLSDANDIPNPDELFRITAYLWNWLAFSDFRVALGSVVADLLSARWVRAIEDQRFMLTAPKQTVPAIEMALDSSQRGVAKLAEIVLAAQHAVRPTLNAEMKELLEKSVAGRDS